VPSQNYCQHLEKLNQEAIYVLSEVRRIRRSRDLNFFEDADLNGQKHDTITTLIKHLLAGHDGQPCPAGSRPIVTPGVSSRVAAKRHVLMDALTNF
jgi:hypothetical protein